MLAVITGIVRRRPVSVILIWMLLLTAGFTVGTGVFSRLTTAVGASPGSESQRSADLVAQAHLAPPTVTAIVSGRPATEPALRTSVRTALADVTAISGVTKVSDPYGEKAERSKTGQGLMIDVELQPGTGKVAATAAEVAARIKKIDAPRVVVAGGPLTDTEFDEQVAMDTRKAEITAAPVLLILLIFVFASIIVAGLPLLIAVAGVAGTFGTLFTLSFFTDVAVSAIQVTTMLSIGLAVDYSLLVVNRFREERVYEEDPARALARACETAGRTVLFSGLTVSVSLAGLLVFKDPFLRSLGVAGASVVAIDMVAALTLLPALLTLLARRIKPARSWEAGSGRRFAVVATAVQRRPYLVLIATLAAMSALALPALGLRLSVSDPRSLPTSTQTRMLYDDLRVQFPQLAHPNPIVIAAKTSPGSPELAAFGRAVDAVPGVALVSPGRSGEGVSVLLAFTDSPANSEAAARAVRQIRKLDTPLDLAVGGDPAKLVDYRADLAERAPLAAAIVLAVTLLLLFLFSGSVLVPIRAVLTNFLSVAAALGAVVWAFQDGHLSGLFGASALDGIDITVPVLVAAIAFGLSMDYEVFLMARIRDRRLAGASPRQAVSEGLQRSGRIITAAAMLLVVAFAGFLPAGFVPVQEIGLGLVLAVALDAIVVRTLLVPATMGILGAAAWWAPGALRRAHDRVGLKEEVLPEAVKT
jgi:RND superfamily putative drug exporter